MYFVYLLENQNDKSWKLIYFENYINEVDARGREIFLKSGSGRRFLKKQLAHYLAVGI